MNLYRNIFKRLLDLSLSLIAVILLSPILLLSSILIKLTSKGPLFFTQDRLGKDGRIFKVYKFRTMTDEKRDFAKQVYTDNAEITGVGKVLRRFKIDELPQLLNILKGDMSIVGPRPGLPGQEKDFNEDGKQRLKVVPGLTGLAQVNGNIYLSWPDRWKYDREYAENLSLPMDIKIILKTVGIVLFGEEKFLKKKDA